MNVATAAAATERLATLRMQLAAGHGRADRPRCPTGFAELDAVLPERGWPVGALSEILHDAAGIGELALALPALARLSRAGRALAWVAPPHIPYPPALVEHGIELAQVLVVRVSAARALLWTLEQLLRSPGIGAVLAWPDSSAQPGALDDRHLRRLQLAAETGGSCGLLYRPLAAARTPSPAALRLQLTPGHGGLHLQILKARGGFPHALVVHPSAAACA